MSTRAIYIIRQILVVRDVGTVGYCQEQGIAQVEDLSNADPRFLRNRIRHELVPLLESLHPGIHSTLLSNAGVIRVDVEWLATQVDDWWPVVVISGQVGVIKLRTKEL